MQNNEFTDYMKAINNVLELDMNTELAPNITLRSFLRTCIKHPGWQNPIMRAIDQINYKYLFVNGVDLTAENIAITKTHVYDYFTHYVHSAVLTGYEI